MRKTIQLFSLAVVCFSLHALYAQDEKAAESGDKASSLKTEAEKVSYALGLQIGNSLKRLQEQLTDAGLDKVDVDKFVLGLKACLSDEPAAMTEEEAQKVRNDFFANMRKAAEAKRKAEGEKAQKAGKEFLEANKGKEGVVTTKSGLQYQVLKEGTGKKPLKTDRVEVHYKGTLIDGSEFDSSYSRNKPATFRVTGVIKGWQEGLTLMTVGSKFKFFIPSDLAYGSRGSGAKIPPHSVLIFEVELLNIEKGAPKPPTRTPTLRKNPGTTGGSYGPPPPSKK